VSAQERRARQWWGCRLHVERRLARELARIHGRRRVVTALQALLRERPLTRLDAALIGEGLRGITGHEPGLPRGLRHGHPRFHHVPAVALAFIRSLPVAA